jgi:5-methyltetrahydrofolate--homocysteine methyltransferase
MKPWRGGDMPKYEDLAEVIFRGEDDRSTAITRGLIDRGVDPIEILNDGLYPGMEVVGARFKAGEMFIPEVLIAARAMHAAMEVLKPLLTGTDASSKGTVLLGTVQGDLHDIGKNLVGMMLEGGGFNVVDIGVDIPTKSFLEEAKTSGANIVGMSTLLTTTMPSMKAVVAAFRENRELKKVKIMVGGAPVTKSYADSIDADGYAPDASSAVDLANEVS